MKRLLIIALALVAVGCIRESNDEKKTKLGVVVADVGIGSDGEVVATPAEALTTGVRVGTQVELTAPTGTAGYAFDGWTGDILSTDNPLVFAIENAMTNLSATYREVYTVCPTGEVAVELSNGTVIWAGSNLSAYQTFAENPWDIGCLFQWGWKDAVEGVVIGTKNVAALPNGEEIQIADSWPQDEDPCPFGWRIPTQQELMELVNIDDIGGESPCENTGDYTQTSWSEGAGEGTGLAISPVAGVDTEKTLYFPNVGFRCNGEAFDPGENNGIQSFYWSSTQVEGDENTGIVLQPYTPGDYRQISMNYTGKDYQCAVRCVRTL